MNTDGISRADFIRGNFRQSKPADAHTSIRPPAARHEAEFTARCNGCGLCVEQCPENLIELTPDKHAHLVFKGKANGCSFCLRCANVCPSDAFDLTQTSLWKQKATIDASNCLSHNGIVCRLCGDCCSTNAIKFKLMTAGRALPIVNQDKCTACGDCIVRCPADAINLVSDESTNSAASNSAANNRDATMANRSP